MYKLDLPIDLKEAAIIENRRYKEEQRKSRIFNSKIRQIGIDTNALNEQINQKKHHDQLVKDHDLLYAAQANRMDKIIVLMEKRQQEDLRELNRVLNEFRFLHQKPDQRREFDLYDPDKLKKDFPARVSDDDPRCGVASIQKFDGEDLNGKYRENYQKEQMKNWLEMQILDRNRSINTEKQSQRLYDLKQIELDIRTCNLMNSENECKRAINLTISNYNDALAREKAEKERLKLIQDEDDKRIHIINSLKSDLLTENPSQAISAFGSHRVIPDRFKGMTSDQLEHIHKIQKNQMMDKKIKEEEERKINELWDKQRSLQARTGLLIENEILRNKKMLDKNISNDNMKLAKEHKEIYDYLNKEVYTNQPTASYFMQFNTCSR